MQFDIPKLKADIHKVEEEIREMKSALRSTWLKPMWKEQDTLRTLKWRATKLYATRAYTRGKEHIPRATLLNEIAEENSQNYLKSSEAA